MLVMVMVMVGKEDNKGSRGERGLREGLYLLILPDQNMQNSFHHSLIMMKAMLKMLTRAAHKEALDTFRSPFKFCPYLERTYWVKTYLGKMMTFGAIFYSETTAMI